MSLPDGRSPHVNRLLSELKSPDSTTPKTPATTETRSSEKKAASPEQQQRVMLSATQWMAQGTTLEEDLDSFQKAGLTGIGVSELKIDECGREKAAELLNSSPLAVTSVDWIANFTGYNGFRLNDTIHEASRLIRFAARVKAATVTVVTGPRHNHTKRHSESLVVDSLRTLGRVAEDLGVNLALMPMHESCEEEWTFLNGLNETVSLLERIDSPNVGMLFNTFHLRDQPGLPARIAEPSIARWIKLVRIADWDVTCDHENDQRFPGEGSLPLSAMLGSLHRAGYAGYHEIDVWSDRTWQRDPLGVLSDAARFCQSHIPAPKPPLVPADRSKKAGINSTFEAVLRPA